MITFVPTPPSSSPLSAIQGDIAYGDGNDATTTVITYSLAQYADTQAWTTGYREEFRAALAVIESVANIDFVEVSLASNPDLVEVLAPSSWFSSPNTLGFHYTPSNSTSFGAYNTDYWIEGVNGAPGGYFFTTILHELGHALGLGHPHDDGLGTTVLQGVTSEFDSFGNAGLNQGVFTVMSYNDGWTSQNGILPVSSTYGGSTGLGALDIAALQALYGANTTTNSAGNTYFLPSSNTAGTGYESIWDTGGIDTIQSDSSSSTIIDLREATLTYSNGGGGYVSYVNGVEGGFTIANGVVIENATGGSGNDTLIGNTAENVLNGRGGNDVIRSRSDGSNDNTINGGSGNDTIYLANGSGADTVNGNEGNDRAIVTNNTGSFAGGVGTDTVVFVKGLKNYLVETNGSNYEFFNVITRDTFTVANDVEVFQFANGSQSFNSSNLTSATQIRNIETTGTVLQHADHGVYVLGGSTAKIALTRNGIIIGEDSLNGWTAIHTEADSSGYRLLWQHNDGRYLEWDINDQGAWQSGALVDNVVDVEVFYGVDFNNDGTIGHTITAVENAGSTTLSSSTQGVYLIDGSTQLTRNGDLVGPDSLNGWTALHAEADSSGYRLLWQHSDGRYLEWDINDQGAWQDGALVDNVVDVESFYGVDFNNDGTIGHTITAVENTGSATLSSSTQGVYLIDGSTQLTRNGELIG
ncbi:M10 family metallopeptidase C-terminal domain-containing protein, partial [Ruegeria sp.]|uniref:M10 family metallopeptidase C-terminal domain-containing protein n=1 Tax=Ruegeria sp. TaxID=1879320 RepID=UPI00230AA476